mgnify:CR=1 FL=1
MKKTLITLLGIVLCGAAVAVEKPAGATMEQYVDALMRRMTLEEKIGQLNLPSAGDITTGQAKSSDIAEKIRRGEVGGLFNIKGVEKIRDVQRIAVEESRLGIPLIFGMDVIHGYETTFPIPLGLTATWDMEAVEASAAGICWTFSPMVEIARDPRWGRASEGIGEDPFLGSAVARSFVYGYQGRDPMHFATDEIMGCVKHYALYGAAEAGRDYNTTDMSRQRMYNEYFPPYKAAAGLGGTQLLFIFFALLALLTGGCLVYYFSRRNVRPIIELGQELQTAVEVQKNLQEVVDSQRPIICTSYVRQLLSGTATSEDEVTYMENYLGIADSSYYNVLYIVYYNNFGDNTEITLPGGVESMEELEKIIESALENFFGTPLFYFSPSDRTYSVLLHCSEEEGKDLILKINNCILRLHDYLLDTYDIWLFAGIGRNTDSLMNVWECYQQASEAVSYTTKNYIFFPYEFIKKDSNVFYYPPEISTKLIHFISTGNTPQVLEMFNLIHQENIEERTLPVNLLKYLLSDIRNTLLKARFELPQDADPEAVKVLDERFNEHLTFKLCEDLALSLCNLFGNKEDDNTLSSTIEKYIKDNYKDPSLGLNKISDEFQISESYFSHMFKEKTGVNFSTYLENIRMAEAARLIQETDISLNELYIAVGYNNSNTFRRAFKKVYGVTPSAMREK